MACLHLLLVSLLAAAAGAETWSEWAAGKAAAAAEKTKEAYAALPSQEAVKDKVRDAATQTASAAQAAADVANEKAQDAYASLPSKETIQEKAAIAAETTAAAAHAAAAMTSAKTQQAYAALPSKETVQEAAWGVAEMGAAVASEKAHDTYDALPSKERVAAAAVHALEGGVAGAATGAAAGAIAAGSVGVVMAGPAVVMGAAGAGAMWGGAGGAGAGGILAGATASTVEEALMTGAKVGSAIGVAAGGGAGFSYAKAAIAAKELGAAGLAAAGAAVDKAKKEGAKLLPGGSVETVEGLPIEANGATAGLGVAGVATTASEQAAKLSSGDAKMLESCHHGSCTGQLLRDTSKATGYGGFCTEQGCAAAHRIDVGMVSKTINSVCPEGGCSDQALLEARKMTSDKAINFDISTLLGNSGVQTRLTQPGWDTMEKAEKMKSLMGGCIGNTIDPSSDRCAEMVMEKIISGQKSIQGLNTEIVRNVKRKLDLMQLAADQAAVKYKAFAEEILPAILAKMSMTREFMQGLDEEAENTAESWV